MEVSQIRGPEVATTRVMAETLAIFYAFGGAAGLLVSFGVDGGTPRFVLLGLSLVAFMSAAVAHLWAARWPRQAFHLPVGAATVMIVGAVLVSPDPVTASRPSGSPRRP